MRFLWHRDSPAKLTVTRYRAIFRRVFLSEDGQKALRILLKDWKFFDPCLDEADRAMNEYAKFFINERLGLADIYLTSSFTVDETIRHEREKQERTNGGNIFEDGF